MGVVDGFLLGVIIIEAAQAHADDVRPVVRGIVDALYDAEIGGIIVRAQDAHRQDLHVRRDAGAADAVILGGGNDAGAVGAVAVLVHGVVVPVDEVPALDDLALELRVGIVHAGVQHSHRHPVAAGGHGPGRIGVDHVVHVLVVPGGVAQKEVGIAHGVHPRLPVLLHRDLRTLDPGIGGDDTVLQRHRLRADDVVGVHRGQGVGGIHAGLHRLIDAGAAQTQQGDMAGIRQQLRVVGVRDHPGVFRGAGADHDLAVHIVHAGDGLAQLAQHVVFRLSLFAGQLLLGEAEALRQAGEAIGQRRGRILFKRLLDGFLRRFLRGGLLGDGLRLRLRVRLALGKGHREHGNQQRQHQKQRQ